jgi:ribA/ribD-fused uncharacterized protein
MTSTINSFTGRYEFLSNFFPSPIALWAYTGDLREFPTVEHVFQSFKTEDPIQFESIRTAPTPGKAKRLGKACTLRKDWEEIKLEVMFRALTEKFRQNADLYEQLLSTGTALLVEGNNWGDVYWGVCGGVGENHLGKLLMRVRDDLRAQRQFLNTPSRGE